MKLSELPKLKYINSLCNSFCLKARKSKKPNRLRGQVLGFKELNKLNVFFSPPQDYTQY